MSFNDENSSLPLGEGIGVRADTKDIAIRIENLSKCYQIYDTPRDRLKQFVAPRLQSLAGQTPKQYFREFWALKDVSFEVKKGETVGIIGRNGSGKSTLLQIICGTLSPTGGNVETRGRIAALLELGSGFNPEFTGRENVYMNAAVLGLSREEVDARFDDIAAFADIGQFIEQPVKTYSSGMFVRLAFAIQAHIDASIVIIDEALAVGDVFFRQKCYARIEQLRNSGTAILLVSHSMPDIEQYCERAILLDRGVERFIGPSSEAAKHYYLSHQAETRVASKPATDPVIPQVSARGYTLFDRPPQEAFIDLTNKSQISNGQARCIGVALCNATGQACNSFRQGDLAVFYYEFELIEDIGVPICGLTVTNEWGVIVHGKNSLQYSDDIPPNHGAGLVVCRQEVVLDIAPGEYVFQVGLASIGVEDWCNRENIPNEEQASRITRVCHVPQIGSFAVGLSLRHGISFLTHHGIANLSGAIKIATMPVSEKQDSSLKIKNEKPLVLTEFPKSGGSWIVSLMGEALNLPRRDIYVKPGFDLFDVEKHPWYKRGDALDFPDRSVIKSHELPESTLIDFDAIYVHLVRDGRDVVVSKWFFDKEFCVRNGITSSFDESFDEYVEKTAREWANYVAAWAEKSVITIRYEEFLSNPVHALERLLIAVGYTNISEKELESAVSKFTKEKFKASLGGAFKHNTFVRKGISGDWKNHFSEDNVVAFKRIAGNTLLSLGYEMNSDWNI